MSRENQSWQIVPYEGDSPYKKVRVRDEARIQAVLRHLLADECVALLGSPMCEKSRLLHDVATALHETGRYRPLYVDLWKANSADEAAFFTSVSQLVFRALDNGAAPQPASVPGPRAFQNYLGACLAAQDRHLVLLIDHLQALPHDLVHSLLLSLRSAFMEREADAPRQLVAVVTGGMNLVGLSTGPTSPFNIAKPVVALPLDEEQTRALVEATLAAHGCRPSDQAVRRLVEWLSGDQFLVPRICAWSVEFVRSHRQPRVTRAVVDRAMERLWQNPADQAPIREAIRMIEEDPDTMLDILHLLDHERLPRARARQMITRTGTDRLQLSGAALLRDGAYTLKNQAFRRALGEHFSPERVGHILRIAGRWSEAIDYLAPLLTAPAAANGSPPYPEPGVAEAGAVRPLAARPQLLEAIVQAIYATDSLVAAYEVLARGLRLGFGLADVAIYRVRPAMGQLELVYPPQEAGAQPPVIDLRDRDAVEAQTFHYGNYALRGSAHEVRLVAALASPQRPLGIVTVEHYVRERDPHELPHELPELLRFLRHAAGAVENVTTRAAYRRIGQAVLSASTARSTLDQVLETVGEALGCDFAALYLVDDAGSALELAASAGRSGQPGTGAAAVRLERTGRHPAATALSEGRLVVARGGDERLPAALVERFGLRDYVMAYLPLQAGGSELGTLELGYAASLKLAFAEESRRTLAAFADQVAIAVHNTQLLRRTDAALARRVEELEKLRSSSLAVSSTLDLDAVLAAILRDVQALFPDTETTVWQYHPEPQDLTVLQSSLADAEYRRQRLGLDSVTGQAVAARRPALESDLSLLTTAPIRDPAVELGLRGMVAVPLVSRDRVLGAINLYTYQDSPHPVTLAEAGLLGAFAAQAAVAIDNARLHQDELQRQRMEEELTVGRRIQQSMLPRGVPQVAGWEFAAVYQAARIVGGDFYDFYELPGQPVRLGVLVADVADKGVPAALFMALSRTIIRTTALSGRGPASALTRANELIRKDTAGDVFLSAAYAVLELDTGRVVYVNAGHNRPLWYRAATQDVVELRARGVVLGILEDIRLDQQRLDLAPGDVLVLYTDGLTEALNAAEEEFGKEAVMAVVAEHARGSAEAIRDALMAALSGFTGDAEPGDDVTCVVVKRAMEARTGSL